MIKKNIKQLIALVLTFSVLCTMLISVTIYAEPEDYYINAVIENFEESFEESNYYDELCSDKYYYEQFSDNLEDMNWAGKAVVWATNSLLDKKLNKDAYVNYLVNLLSMMQNGLAETSYNQAQYNVTKKLDDKVTSLALKVLFTNKSAADMFEDVTGMMEGVISVDEEVQKSKEQLMMISYAISNYENQYLILDSIKNNTEEKALKQACDELKEVYASQCAYISDQCVKDQFGLIKSAGEFVWKLYGDEYTAKINSGFVSWLWQRTTTEGAERTLRILAGAGKMANILGYIDVGFKIGAGIMDIFVGDEVELFREEMALAKVSDALTASLIDTKNAAMSGAKHDRYFKIKDYVILTNVLIYTHTRGEYCHVQSSKPEYRDGTGKVYYDYNLCPLMHEYNQVASGILKDGGGDILERTIAALDGVESVHLSQSSTSDYTVMGKRVTATVALESDSDLTQGVTHIKMSMYGKGGPTNDIYTEMEDDSINVYMHTAGVWVKQTGIPVSDIYKLGGGGGYEGLEGVKFYLSSMEDAVLEEASEGENYVISGIIGSRATEEALRKAGLSTLIDMLDSNDAISDADIQNLINNLAPMRVRVLVDKDTFLPSKMTIDMRDTTESLYENINELAARDGESISYDITTSQVVTDFSSYNDVPKIVIPDDALNGTEYTLVY